MRFLIPRYPDERVSLWHVVALDANHVCCGIRHSLGDATHSHWKLDYASVSWHWFGRGGLRGEVEERTTKTHRYGELPHPSQTLPRMVNFSLNVSNGKLSKNKFCSNLISKFLFHQVRYCRVVISDKVPKLDFFSSLACSGDSTSRSIFRPCPRYLSRAREIFSALNVILLEYADIGIYAMIIFASGGFRFQETCRCRLEMRSDRFRFTLSETPLDLKSTPAAVKPGDSGIDRFLAHPLSVGQRGGVFFMKQQLFRKFFRRGDFTVHQTGLLHFPSGDIRWFLHPPCFYVPKNFHSKSPPAQIHVKYSSTNKYFPTTPLFGRRVTLKQMIVSELNLIQERCFPTKKIYYFENYWKNLCNFLQIFFGVVLKNKFFTAHCFFHMNFHAHEGISYQTLVEWHHLP
jgi:hypothetical protein